MSENCIQFALRMLGIRPETDSLTAAKLKEFFVQDQENSEALAIIHQESGTVAHMAVRIHGPKMIERPGVGEPQREVREHRIVQEYLDVQESYPNTRFSLLRIRRR